MSKRKKILDGHKKVGNKFIPPAIRLTNLSELSWVEDLLPELIWVGVIIAKYGLQKGIEYSSFMIAAASEISKSENPKDFSFLSSYRLLNENEQKELIIILKEKGYYSAIEDALAPFIYLYPVNNPLDFIIANKEKINREIAIKEFKEVLDRYFNRRSKHAMIMQTVVPYSNMRSGKLHYAPHIKPTDFNAIVEDFDSDNAKKAMSSVRSLVNATYGHISDTITKDWAKYFWNNGIELEKLDITYLTDIEYEYQGDDPYYLQVTKYDKLVDQAVIKRWNQIPKSVYEHHAIEVIGALLARQATLAKRIARDPDTWDFHIGPILLRAMIDLHITLAWVLTDPNKISKTFIMYGLGQEKLQIEHLEDENDENDDKPLLDILIDARKSWLTDQRYSFLTTVDVGNWSGHSTRDIAEESGCRNLYRFAYSPFSSCAHSMWNHVGKFNVRFSENPLHKHIRLPFDPNLDPHPETLINSAKYLYRTLDAIDTYYKLEKDDFDPVEFWHNFFISEPERDDNGLCIRS